MERLGARDLPCVMWALRLLMGLIGMVLLSAMALSRGWEKSAKYAAAPDRFPIALRGWFDTLGI